MDPMPSILGFNGPKPIADDPDAAGMLDWANFADNNDDKAVGGHVGLFLPVAGVGKLKRQYTALILLLLVAVAGFGRNALAGSRETRKVTTDSGTTNTGESSMQLSGEELWSNNCQGCHNIRPPTMYSNAQWDVIVHHMRV